MTKEIFYVSIRPININGKRLLTPKYMLNDGFPGVPLTWQCVGGKTKTDGRYLYKIITDSIEHRGVILEGLQMWGVHLKTLSSAKVLLEKLTGRKDLFIKDGIIEIPEQKDEWDHERDISGG